VTDGFVTTYNLEVVRMDEELVLKTSSTLIACWGFDSLRFRHIVSWCNGLAPITTDDKVWVRIPRRLRWRIKEGNGVPACLLNKNPLSWAWFESTVLRKIYRVVGESGHPACFGSKRTRRFESCLPY